MGQADPLVELVDRAVGAGEGVEQIVDTLRSRLCELIRSGTAQLPERLTTWHGSIEVLQFELVERRQDGLFRFEKRGSMQAGIGSAGCLIPPHEYHVIRNAAAEPAVSVHIYGGDMTYCNVFEDKGGGWFQRREKPLGLDE